MSKVDKVFYKVILLLLFYNLALLFFTEQDSGYTSQDGLKCGIYVPYLFPILLAFGWFIFSIGLFQLSAYCKGKDRLLLANLIFGFISGYMLFLSLPYLIANSSQFFKSIDYNLAILFIASLITIVISNLKSIKMLHLKSKQEYTNELKRKLEM